MSSQPEDGWHGGSGSGDGQAPPAGNAAGDAAFPNPMEPIQGAEGVLPATAPAQRTPGAVGPRQGQGQGQGRERQGATKRGKWSEERGLGGQGGNREGR